MSYEPTTDSCTYNIVGEPLIPDNITINLGYDNSPIFDYNLEIKTDYQYVNSVGGSQMHIPTSTKHILQMQVNGLSFEIELFCSHDAARSFVKNFQYFHNTAWSDTAWCTHNQPMIILTGLYTVWSTNSSNKELLKAIGMNALHIFNTIDEVVYKSATSYENVFTLHSPDRFRYTHISEYVIRTVKKGLEALHINSPGYLSTLLFKPEFNTTRRIRDLIIEVMDER